MAASLAALAGPCSSPRCAEYESGLEILLLLASGAYCTPPASMALRASCKA